MHIGLDEMEVETQAVKTEDQDPRTNLSHEETEEKPERSRDSTIHTAHQFLMDTVFQVRKFSQITALIS